MKNTCILLVAKGRFYAKKSQTFSRKTKKIAQYGRERAVGKDFRMILGGFAIFAVDIVRAIS